MKYESKRLTSECPYIAAVQHDIRKLLQDLKFAPKLYSKLSKLTLDPIIKRGKEQKREVYPREYNQMWRYGASSTEDVVLEAELDAILKKISEDLR